MKQVFNLWFLRSMIPLLLIEFLGLAVALFIFARVVFVGAVVNNALTAALGNPLRFIGYLWSAFLGAGILVQVLVLLLMVGLAFVLRDINRSLISYALMRHRDFHRKSE